eukprot:12529781-Alexandrium_andersonii.AAC.1
MSGGLACGFAPRTKAGFGGRKAGRWVWGPKSSAIAGWTVGAAWVLGRWVVARAPAVTEACLSSTTSLARF